MRSSIFFAAPFVAAAYAQSSSEANGTVRVHGHLYQHQCLLTFVLQVVEISTSGSTVSTTVPYTNGFVSFYRCLVT